MQFPALNAMCLLRDMIGLQQQWLTNQLLFLFFVSQKWTGSLNFKISVLESCSGIIESQLLIIRFIFPELFILHYSLRKRKILYFEISNAKYSLFIIRLLPLRLKSPVWPKFVASVSNVWNMLLLTFEVSFPSSRYEWPRPLGFLFFLDLFLLHGWEVTRCTLCFYRFQIYAPTSPCCPERCLLRADR